MYSVNFIDFVLELQPQADFLIEGLIDLFKVFLDVVTFLFEVGIGQLQVLQLLYDFFVFLSVVSVNVVDEFLPFCNLLPHFLHIFVSVVLNIHQHCLKFAFRTVFQ